MSTSEDEGSKKRSAENMSSEDAGSKKRPAEKKPRDDFPLIQQASEKAQQKMENAFPVMIEASKKAGAYSTPIKDCVRLLEQRPDLRDFLGLLMQEEEAEAESDEEVGPTVKSRVRGWFCDSHSVASGGSPATSEDKDSQGETEDKPKADATDGKKYPPLPPPPSEPSRGACLRAITVHIRGPHYSSKVLGFTFRYSDEVEVQTGEVEVATHHFCFRLQENEHILGVQPCHRSHRPKYVTRVRFRTSKGRWLEAGVKQSDSENFFWWPREWGENFELTCTDGDILHSIDWDLANLTILSLQTVPLPNDYSSSNQEKPTVPRLQDLAYKAADDYFKGEAVFSRCWEQKTQEILRASTHNEVASIFDAQKQKLESSPETVLLRHARSFLVVAQRKFDARATELLTAASSQAGVVQKRHSEMRRTIRDKGQRKSDAVLEQHRDFLKFVADAAAVPEDQREALCAAFPCRKLFHPGKLPKHKRCSIPDCNSAYENCGCNINICTRCHATLCSGHFNGHESTCQRTFREKCGLL
jgi:hypothetical protein